MDKMLYIAMSGAGQIQRAQTRIAHNLANANTTGFKADLESFQARALYGDGQPSRVYTEASGAGFDRGAGALIPTGGELDVAIEDAGFIAVQSPDGGVAYTRAGDLRITANGLLETGAGHPVLGQNGPIVLPPGSRIEIGRDGTVSLIPPGERPNTLAVLDRIELADPDPAQLIKKGTGLFHLPEGQKAEPDANVHLISGMLEASNVRPSTALIDMIALSRQYEMQVKLMKTAEDNDAAASRLLRME
ncbi:MAG: flagellar basal-body rod protein FlgF [Candidatus Macondimonas sp.]